MNFKLKLTALAVGITLFISCSKDDSLEEQKTINFTIASKQRSNNLGSEHYNSGELTNLNNSKWMSALPDSKKIGDYICYKATTIVENHRKIKSEIVVWFTPEIPFQYGPKNYGGLPGLILALQERGHYFYAKKINH